MESHLAFISIIVHLTCIALAWWALSAIQFDKILHVRKVVQARLLYILLAIALGSSVSNFLLSYSQLGTTLSQMLN